MLAEEMECLLVCVCGCAHMSGAVSDESRTLPQYFVPVYLFKCVVASSRNTACACVFVSEEGKECPARTQLSKYIPVSCLAFSCQNEITSHGLIYLFYRTLDHHLASALSCMSPRCPKTRKVLGKLLWEPSKAEQGGRKVGLEEKTYELLFNHLIFLLEVPMVHLPILGPESLRVA